MSGMGFFLGKSAKFFDRQKLAFIFLNEKKYWKRQNQAQIYTQKKMFYSHTLTINSLRRSDGRGYFYTLFIFFYRRNLWKDKGNYLKVRF